MSLSFGGGSKSSTSKQKSDVDPWDYSIPYLQDFLKEVGAVGGTGLTPDQKSAYAFLKRRAFEGNPWDEAQAQFANDLFASPERASQVGQAYQTLQQQLGDYASGKYLDPMSNPQVREMLTMVGDDVANRINAQFAAAGRDLSGMNQQAVARGVTQAQVPLLLDQFNRNQAMQIDAAKTLYGAGAGTSTTQQALDEARARLRGAGAAAADKALEMDAYGPNQILNLDQQIKSLPYEDLALLGSLLFPVASAGQQSSGINKTDTKTSSFGLGLNILSDEAAKEGIEEIGQMADGQKLYRWRYKGDPTGTIHVGPLAQEVEKAAPEAVSNDGPGGLKTVNMDAATRKAAEIVRQRRSRKSGGY